MIYFVPLGTFVYTVDVRYFEPARDEPKIENFSKIVNCEMILSNEIDNFLRDS